MRNSFTGLATALVLIGSTQMASAEAGAVVTALMAKQTIGEAQAAVDEGLDRAKAIGSALISQTASSASILIQTLSMELGGNLTDLERDLRPEEVTLLGKISNLTDQLHGLQPAAYDFKDSTVIDFSNLEAALPFVHLPYFIQRIRGLSQVVSDGGDYLMTLSAFGLTPGSSQTASSVRLVDATTGKEIDTRVNITGNGQASIVITNAALRQYFDPNKVVILPIDIEVSVVRHKHILPDQHFKITAKVGLSLFPTKAGHVTVTAYKPTYDRVKTQTLDSPHVASGDGEEGHSVVQTIDLPGSGVANPHVGNQTFANPHQHCVMKVNNTPLPRCNDGDVNQNGWFEIIKYPAIMNNGTRLEWEGKGYHQPKFLWVTYDVMEYQVTGDAATKTDYDIKWGESVDFALPDGFTHYRIDGQSIMFQNISLNGGKASPMLQFEEVSHGPNSVATYHISPPPD